jgi:putative hydrolase of the HAD superfamily
MIRAVFFDFGGVIAEEGWENGLREIASRHGFEPAQFFADCCDVLWSTGYMYGRATEQEYWDGISGRYDFKMTHDEMRGLIFERFAIRGEMIELIKDIGRAGYRLAILSDQTNWLDEFDGRYGFYKYFEEVYNSYRLGKGKKDQTVFAEVCADFGVPSEETLFVDDNAGHIERAQKSGLAVYHFTDFKSDIIKIKELLKI